MTAGYQVVCVATLGELWPSRSASWSIEELPGLVLSCEEEGWQMMTGDTHRLPQWLTPQMVESGYDGILYWSRGPFPTRRALLEALRLEQERAEAPEPAVQALTELLA